MKNQDVASIIMSQASLEDPIRYANLIRASKSDDIKAMKKVLPSMKKSLEQYEKIAKFAKDLHRQIRGDGYARRRNKAKDMFSSLDQQMDSFSREDVDLSEIIYTHYDRAVQMYSDLVQGTEFICNANMVSYDETINKWSEELTLSKEIGEERISALLGVAEDTRKDTLSTLAMEQKINKGAQVSFIRGLSCLESVLQQFDEYILLASRMFESYYDKLRSRHADGTVIANYMGNPSVTLTDAAIMIWENVDRVGEIEGGVSKDEVSAFTLHRANAMVNATKSPAIWRWILEPEKELLSWATYALETIKQVRTFVINIKEMLGESVWKIMSSQPARMVDEFEDVIMSLELSQITQRQPEHSTTKIERFALEHKNKSIEAVAALLVDGASLKSIADEILELKIKEHQYLINENSFYVCRIGTGNQFAGIAPGALEVIPGERPIADLEYIWGEGFDEIRDFLSGMDEARKWQPIFLSTSPSKSTDKNNILLVGPQGCGKSMVMKAIGGSVDNISIFALGSSFGTAWANESQKNPKRLFDEAVKLNKTSGKPVYILIDEIDSVLNNDRTSGGSINLSLEFQNLMDGVVAYPGITVVGATNHPDRIPTPMIRRFSKVLVVGELSDEDRKQTLKHYIETFLPCEGSGFSDEDYSEWSKRLDGATGDVLRKAVDRVWLKIMRIYINQYKEHAEGTLDYINSLHSGTFDVSKLNNDERENIKNRVAECVFVRKSDVDDEVDETLSNLAIRRQIDVSKKTYKKARDMMKKHKLGIQGVGF